MNLPKRSSFKRLLNVHTLSEILLWITKPSYFSFEMMRVTPGACIKSGCLAQRPLCRKVNLPASCEVRRPLCHKVNLLSCVARRPQCHRVNLPSCVARRPLFNKVNLPRCEARRRLFITVLNSMIYIIYILLPCFCIIFPRFCSVFNKTALLSANPQNQEFFFHVYIIMMKNRLHSNNSLSSETVSVSVQFQCIFCQKKKYICIQTFKILQKICLKIKET